MFSSWNCSWTINLINLKQVFEFRSWSVSCKLSEEILLLVLDFHLSSEVWVIQSLFSWDSAWGFFLQHSLEQVECFSIYFSINVFLKVEIASSILVEDFIILFPFEYRVSKEEIMKDNASWKDIAYWLTFSAHIFDVNDLWCYKSRSSTSHKQVLLFICISGKSEIADGKVRAVLLPEHDVLRFEISMYDSQFGQMTECSEDILDNLFDFSLFYFFIAFEQLIELLALKVFQNHVDRIVSFINSLQFHYI